MEENMENGSNRVYRGEWTSEMPRWIGWPSDVSSPAKHISNDGSSTSDDSTVFNDTKQISAPPLQLHDFTGSSPLWGHDFLLRSGSLSYDPRLDRTNVDMNMIKQEHPGYDFECQFQPAAAGLPFISRKAPNMPAMFPGTAVATGEEGQISKSLSTSSCNAPLAAGSHSSNQLLFYSNNLPFWKGNPEIPSAKHNSTEGPRHERPSCGNVAQIKDSGVENRKSSSEPKRPRSESVAPFTTFKVRKEKLGDRINALQQLVSPFGKTDTASVLFDAIEYIKLLHDQVTVLSTPYMRMSRERCEGRKERDGTDEQGLRSRGLCLVPIATTLHVAKDNSSTDFWAPTFGGSYR